MTDFAKPTGAANDAAGTAAPPAATPPAADPPAADPPAANLSDAARLAAEEALKQPPAEVWYKDLPEASHEKLKGFESLEAALSAAERGNTLTGLKAEDYVFDFGKDAEGNDIAANDQTGSIDRFRQFCLENRVDPEAAQALAVWQAGELAAGQADLIAAGESFLKTKWVGTTYDANRAKALVTLALLDRRMEGRLAPALSNSGKVNDPVVVEVLHLVSTLIGEESLGAGGPGGGNDPDKPVDTKTSYQELFKEAKT